MKKYRISASILSADFANLGKEVQHILKAGADFVHFDVMDNHYVPNLTVGPLVCASLRKYGIKAPLDVHLMVKPVDQLIPAFAQAGANYITFHPEATEHIDRTINLIRSFDIKVGLAFNPATPLVYLESILPKLDLVLMMSVNPGFASQKFIPYVLDKITKVAELIKKTNPEILLEVDGGIKINNIRKIAQVGADTFVLGSALFHTRDYQKTIKALRQELQAV
jgi:ribulose-phosphate 3-epimerase